METVLEDFEAHMGLAVGDFAIITKNVMYLACGRPVTFRPLFCLGMRRGKMVVLNRLRRPRNDHGLVGLTFWSRRRYVRSVFLEEQNSPWNDLMTFLCDPLPTEHKPSRREIWLNYYFCEDLRRAENMGLGYTLFGEFANSEVSWKE